MKKRKNKVIDNVDREILRTLCINRPLVSSRIAQSVGLSSSAAILRLNNLQEMGIVRITRTCGVRYFKRNFNGNIREVKSPRGIYWDLDVKM